MELRDKLRSAQDHMKKYGDMKRKFWEFQEGDLVWLKLRPYRQNSVNNRIFTKLSKKFYGPYKIVKKINAVAYRLELPVGSSVFPVFHISLLKPFVSSLEDGQQLAIPTKAIDVHPIVVPSNIIGYRIISRKGCKLEQVLVDWKGLSPLDCTWEDLQ